MPQEFSYHPWQAIMVSLCGISIRRRYNQFQGTLMWTLEECASFCEVLNSFHLVKTRTVKSSVIHSDYRKPIMVT
ncbi:hypothetical protein DICVIV_01151 [Dictyocaulus viviparus]|uniref:Uncharacterized protein n=1 Tax=Dictyocaulus viviparus TaxID=29172 RepID=A0A0D8Y7K7_DICVI|nr:hypothetical protein DICVIV_01151 [Dictyocaulus viviparus]